MAQDKQAQDDQPANRVEKERSQFRRLLLENPNYFGNLTDSKSKLVKKIVANTQYEELTCVGFNPKTNFLEATIAIKRPFGYGGSLCFAGTTEFVRFFVDYGGGWEDAGVAAVSVHDIPNGNDCAGKPEKPLIYVASLKLEAKKKCCTHPVLPKVHAILSWEWMPPAGPANVGWLPPWGNTHDCNIQIQPRPWSIFCLLETLSEGIGQTLKVPPVLEAAKLNPIPIPDPPPFTLADLVKKYSASAVKGAVKGQVQTTVESHRFGLPALHAALSSSAVNQESVAETAKVWDSLGLSFSASIAALAETNANTSYEEIECVGIDDTIPERLVATFRIKRPSGYSGELCYPGSQEYIAFWADWEDTCQWTYLGTTSVNVHDIPAIPKDGLCYSAILPVDLTYHRRHCSKPKVGRIRAVLSWAVPPSTVDPNALNYWGNRLDAHVQINPGDQINPDKPEAKIRNLGGIPIEEIATAGNGMTIFGAKFAHFPAYPADAWGQNRPCPFGGEVTFEGNYFFGYYYRVKVHKVTDPPASFTVLADAFLVERWDSGFDLQSAVGGFYPYLNPALYFDRRLASWNSSGDVMYEVQLDIATAPNAASIIASSPWYLFQLDNTAPQGPPNVPLTMDIHITSGGGDCKDIGTGDIIDGNFIADDVHFGGWSLSTMPNSFTTPSNQPTVVGLASYDPAPAPAGHAWQVNTASPIVMKPCGYVVQLYVHDRTVVNSLPGPHNSNHIEVGFCLRAKKS